MALVLRTVSSIVIASRAQGEWDFLWLSRGFLPPWDFLLGRLPAPQRERMGSSISKRAPDGARLAA